MILLQMLLDSRKVEYSPQMHMMEQENIHFTTGQGKKSMIAATLLPEVKLAHSKLKLPLDGSEQE